MAVAAFVDRLPAWLFLAGVALIDFSPLSVYRYLLLSDVLLLTAVGLELAYRRSATIYFPRFLGFVLVVYLASTAVSFLRPLEPATGLFTWLHSVFLMLVYLPAVTTMFVMRAELRRRAFLTLLASLTLQAGLVVYSVLTTGVDWRSGSRIAGALGSVQFWPYLAALVGAVAVTSTGRFSGRVAGALSLLVLGAAAMLFRARMLWFATILGVCAFAVMQARRRGLGVAIAGFICALLVLGYLTNLYPAAVQERIASTVRPMDSPDLVARVRVALDVSDAVVTSPLIGAGVAQSATQLQELPIPPDILDVHNVVLHAAMEGGLAAALAIALIPVGILLVWRAGSVVVDTDVERTALNWACASLLAIYAGAQLTPTLYEHIFYFLLGFLASMAHARAEKR